MFAKDKVTQSMIDAVNKVLHKEEVAPEQLDEAFPTVADAKKRATTPQPSGGSGIKLGTRYGGGRQADEPEADDDEDKMPKKKAAYGAHQTRRTNTKLYKEDEVQEELKGNQHRIDANKNGKIDAQDFKLLKSKKSMNKETYGEEVEQIDELKTSTMLRYSTKANKALIGGDRSKEEKRIQGINRAVGKIKTRYNKEEVELDEAKKPMSQDEKDKVVAGVQAAMRKSRGNVISGQAQRAAARLAAKVKYGMKEETELDEMTFTERLIESMYGKKSALPLDEKEMSSAQKKKREEIVMSMKDDVAGLKKRYGSRWKDVMYATATKQAMKEEKEDLEEKLHSDEDNRTTDTLAGRVKGGKDNQHTSYKVKYTHEETEKEDEGHEDEKEDKALVKKMVKKDALKEDSDLSLDEQLDEIEESHQKDKVAMLLSKLRKKK